MLYLEKALETEITISELGVNLLAINHICYQDCGQVLCVVQRTKIGVLIDIVLLC